MTVKYEVTVSKDAKWWRVNGKLHRTDGPAIEYANGHKSWCLNGKLHRTDGPAIEWADGSKTWYLDGQLHRDDGPAVEWANGHRVWCLHGRHLTEAEHAARTGGCSGRTVTIDGVEYKLVKK
jgi:hypothetical protein